MSLLEAHLTLAHAPDDEHALHAWLASRALAMGTIELARGAFPRQTMITAWLPGGPEAALREARSIGEGLATMGIRVTRIKLELPHGPTSANVAALYLEHHVKVRTPASNLGALATLAAAHDAHLSRNPHRERDGQEERFLTQRFSAQAAREADAGLDGLLEGLDLAGVLVLKVERERVLHDDNVSLDAGWRTEVRS